MGKQVLVDWSEYHDDLRIHREDGYTKGLREANESIIGLLHELLSRDLVLNLNTSDTKLQDKFYEIVRFIKERRTISPFGANNG